MSETDDKLPIPRDERGRFPPGDIALQKAAGDDDAKRLQKAVDVLDAYMKSEFLRAFNAPTRDGRFHRVN